MINILFVSKNKHQTDYLNKKLKTSGINLISAKNLSETLLKITNQDFDGMIFFSETSEFFEENHEKITKVIRNSNKKLLLCGTELSNKIVFKDIQGTLIVENILKYDEISKEIIEFCKSLNTKDKVRNFKVPRVLLVEDIEFNREIVIEFLEDFNLKIDIAVDGEEAMNKIEMVKYDLILLDFMLPKYDGKDVLLHLRENLGQKHTPVLVLSAQNEIENVKKLTEIGIQGYLVKPIDMKVFQEKVVQLLKNTT